MVLKIIIFKYIIFVKKSEKAGGGAVGTILNAAEVGLGPGPGGGANLLIDKHLDRKRADNNNNNKKDSHQNHPHQQHHHHSRSQHNKNKRSSSRNNQVREISLFSLNYLRQIIELFLF